MEKIKVVRIFRDDFQKDNTLSVEISSGRRTAILVVPDKPEATIKAIQNEIDTCAEARITMAVDNQPLINVTDVEALSDSNHPLSLDTLANEQIIRFPKGHPLEGQLVFDANGKVQYRKTAFSFEGKPDEDFREARKEHIYMSPEIEAEVNGTAIVIKDQALKNL